MVTTLPEAEAKAWPDATGLMTWNVSQVATAITTAKDKNNVAICGMRALANMTASDAIDIGTYLLSIPAVTLAAAFLIWTVAVAVDRNDKDVFPPVLPAVIGIAALVVAVILVGRRSGWAFATTALGTVAAVATLFTSLYPRVMVSAPNFGNSLTVGNASSAHYTLAVMSVVALIVTPLVLLYQGWTYHVFRQRLGGDLRAQPER